jgi:hypothetical protein
MLLFIDESGHDHKETPYEVLAGVAIRERDLWNLIQAIRNAELEFLGVIFYVDDLRPKRERATTP